MSERIDNLESKMEKMSKEMRESMDAIKALLTNN
jgi:hypothetical protein